MPDFTSTDHVVSPLTHETSVDSSVCTDQLSAPTLHPFASRSPIGPTVPVPETPKEIFKLFFTPTPMEKIKEQTNKYEKQVSPPQLNNWTETTVEELYAYLGFNFLMGLNTKPSVRDYWHTDPIYHYKPISDRISRDRYMDISRYLHYVDNQSLPPPGSESYDKLGKVRPLLTYLQEKFKTVYNPGPEVAVDEAMIKFQGRTSLKQYMPMKPIKRGIKVWVLADSSNGYFYWKYTLDVKITIQSIA